MAKITANGMTTIGEIKIEITGDGRVEQIECEDRAFKEFVETAINNGTGWIANGYHPPAGSMLQAYAFLTNVYANYDDVEVEGDIGEIPMSDDPNVIY